MAMTVRCLWVGGVVLVGGCTPIPQGFDSPEPAARMEAAGEAADRGDVGAIPALIGLLDSDDPATRLVAIRSLERLTGETLGYEHAAGEGERGAAIGRWVEWERARADGGVGPAGVSAGEASDG
ncbi:MAG: HEAT repeat domain-containing protein [Phycisphaerales bacterium]|nr:HEAT repeat domain-containing protein [Phycisphaerales bacterium]